MASRMDRYYDRPSNSSGRSRKNEDLYRKIQDMDGYSNIEAVHTIAKTNEIDITKVKELIRNRENYKREKQYRKAFNIEDKPKETEVKEYFQDDKNYDIMDILNKAKDNHNEDTSNRSLKNTHYDLLNELNLRNENYEDGEAELKDLMNTISNKKDDSDDVGLLDELTSNTMVGEASSIHNIIEEEKNEKKKMDNTAEMDKSFFTSTMSFSDEDFEEFKNMGKNVKKNNILIIILMIIMVLAIIGFVLFLIVRR